MAHSKRRRTDHKKRQNSFTQAGRASRKEGQRKKRKEYWASNEAYQKKQEKRLEDLLKHPKYQQNIDDGKKEKEGIKTQRAKKKEIILREKRKRKLFK